MTALVSVDTRTGLVRRWERVPGSRRVKKTHELALDTDKLGVAGPALCLATVRPYEVGLPHVTSG